MRSHFIFAVLFPLLTPLAPAASEPESVPSADVVVARMLARNAQREEQLAGYRGMRQYVLQNAHFHKHAEMLVRVEGDADETKHFEIVREEGWKGALKHVLHKMLELEAKESAPKVRITTRLSQDNYALWMVKTALIDDRMAYVIDVVPKRHDEHLFEGRVWIDAQDYALARIEGRPAKNPSFWTRSVHFVHVYQKRGLFWFPLSTESLTEARIFGMTSLTINYFDYIPNSTRPSETAIAAPHGSVIP
jgi:hypothetical protein